MPQYPRAALDMGPGPWAQAHASGIYMGGIGGYWGILGGCWGDIRGILGWYFGIFYSWNGTDWNGYIFGTDWNGFLGTVIFLEWNGTDWNGTFLIYAGPPWGHQAGEAQWTSL